MNPGVEFMWRIRSVTVSWLKLKGCSVFFFFLTVSSPLWERNVDLI